MPGVEAVFAGFAGNGASPPTGEPGAGCAAGVVCVPLAVEVPGFVWLEAGVVCAALPESVPAGAWAAGVFAGVWLDGVWLDWAHAPTASASANADRAAGLKPMRSVALMTSPPTRWVPRAHEPRFALSLRRKYPLFR